MNRIAYGVAAAAFVLVGCHTITEELPTEPSQTPASGSGVLTVPIPSIPVARDARSQAGAHAGPAADPGPQPTPAPSRPRRRRRRLRAPAAAATPCPPEVSKMNTKIHIRGPNRWTLDTTPLIGPDGEYCRKIGFTDGRTDCPVRPEGSPDRVACETYAIGQRGGHRSAGADLVPQRESLHGRGGRLREPRGQPVPALRLRQRLLRGLHEGRRLRRGAGRPLRAHRGP